MFKIFLLLFFLIVFTKDLLADQYDKRLDYLFDRLFIAEEQKEIRKLTNQIWNIWYEIDDPKMTRAFETGVQMMNLGFHSRAIDYFDKVIVFVPRNKFEYVKCIFLFS